MAAKQLPMIDGYPSATDEHPGRPSRTVCQREATFGEKRPGEAWECIHPDVLMDKAGKIPSSFQRLWRHSRGNCGACGFSTSINGS
jgi:hypothetical protein